MNVPTIDIQQTGANIKALRKAAGIKVKDVADMLGVSPQAVAKWQAGTALPTIATDSSVRNDIENTLILFRCNIPISRLCSANCGLDSYQSLKAECFIYSCKALVRKFTESVRKSNGRILLKGTNPSANVTISKVSDCS